MGKMVITNNNMWSLDMTNMLNPYFEVSNETHMNDFHIVQYKKLNITSENYYFENGNFVCISGTLFYNGKLGKAALKELLTDASKRDVCELRKNMLGSYTIVIKTENIVKIFLDETHTYSFYYYKDDKKYLLTNTFYHIEKCIKAPIFEEGLLERGVRRCIMSHNTPFNNIFKLKANEYFEINLDTGDFELKNTNLNDYSCNYKTKEEAVEHIADCIKEISAIRSKNIKKYLHFLTGGIDSRLEFAVNTYNKDNVTLGYWMGKDVITNGTADDLDITQSIAKYYGVDFVYYDVAESFTESINSISKEKCMKYGEYAGIYCGNSKWYSIFENLMGIEYVGFGYGGEILRSLGELDRSYREPYTIKKFIEDVYCRDGIEKNIISLENFYEFIEKELKNLIEKKETENLSRDNAWKLFAYSRFEADCITNNFINMFTYSFPILCSKKVADAIFSLPYEWLANDSISIMLIKKFEENLLYFPIYSHHRAFKYDKKSCLVKKVFKYAVYDKLKPLIYNTPIYTWGYLKFMHKYIRPQSIANDDILQECKKSISKSRLIKSTKYQIASMENWKGFNVGSLAGFSADIKIIGTLE